MKFTKDNVEAVGLVAIAAIAVYAVYKAYRVGSSAVESVSETISGIGDSISNGVSSITNPVKKAYREAQLTWTGADRSIDTVSEVNNWERNREARTAVVPSTPEEVQIDPMGNQTMPIAFLEDRHLGDSEPQVYAPDPTLYAAVTVVEDTNENPIVDGVAT